MKRHIPASVSFHPPSTRGLADGFMHSSKARSEIVVTLIRPGLQCLLGWPKWPQVKETAACIQSANRWVNPTFMSDLGHGQMDARWAEWDTSRTADTLFNAGCGESVRHRLNDSCTSSGLFSWGKCLLSRFGSEPADVPIGLTTRGEAMFNDGRVSKHIEMPENR